MARLTEEMVIARTKQSDLSAIKKLNCWGAELADVSVVRRMPNVEVIALSINKLSSLADFAWCARLRELYVRKNDIRSLRELRHLRRLPHLASLWLDENPCTDHPQYRLTVLRNLPQLEKLDNVPVTQEEVMEAMTRGVHIADSDDEEYPQQQQEAYSQYRRRRSNESSPEREEVYYNSGAREQGSDSSEEPPPGGSSEARAPQTPREEPPAAMTRSHHEARPARSPDEGSLRHSLSAHSVKEYSLPLNGECRGGAGPGSGGVASPHAHEQYYERPDRGDQYQRCPAEVWERDRDSVRRERDRDGREYPSAVMAEHRGFTRRPVTRNSNLLSAVLCLVKELDYPSLEVAEMAVRCRMDELAHH